MLSNFLFQILKNTTVNASMNIHSKEPIEMSGALLCEFFDLMVSKAQRGWNKCARLFHQPLEQPFYGARHWFDQQVHGKSFTTTAVSKICRHAPSS